jgi:hypothetical protein
MARFSNGQAQLNLQSGTNEGDTIMGFNAFNATTTANGGFNFGGYATVSYMRILPSGKVGIGSTNPGARVEINDAGKNPTLPTLLVDAGNHNESSPIVQFNEEGKVLFVVEGTGNVGIGTSTPGASLAVRGAISANDRVQRWGQGGSSGDHSTMELYKTADKSGDWLFRAYWAGSGSSGKIGFGKYASTPWDGAQMVLDTNTGNVGIGASAPTSKLHVTGGDFVVDNAGYVTQIGHPNGNSYIGGHLIHFRAGAAGSYATKMMIDTPSGNVGIGTSLPNEKLTVNGVTSMAVQTSNPSATAGYGKIYAKAGAASCCKSGDVTSSAFAIASGSNPAGGGDLYTPEDAFNNLDNKGSEHTWLCNDTAQSGNCWIGQDFGAGNEKSIMRTKYWSLAETNWYHYDSCAVDLDYSDDGTNWTTSCSTTHGTPDSSVIGKYSYGLWSNGVGERTITCSDTGAHRYWRLHSTAGCPGTNSGANWYVTEMEMYEGLPGKGELYFMGPGGTQYKVGLTEWDAGTCNDAVKNQDETAVDCGGSCPTACLCTQGVYCSNYVSRIRFDQLDCTGNVIGYSYAPSEACAANSDDTTWSGNESVGIGDKRSLNYGTGISADQKILKWGTITGLKTTRTHYSILNYGACQNFPGGAESTNAYLVSVDDTCVDP